MKFLIIAQIKNLVFFQLGITDLFKSNGVGAPYPNISYRSSRNNLFDDNFHFL
jgi:hypothetical protein